MFPGIDAQGLTFEPPWWIGAVKSKVQGIFAQPRSAVTVSGITTQPYTRYCHGNIIRPDALYCLTTIVIDPAPFMPTQGWSALWEMCRSAADYANQTRPTPFPPPVILSFLDLLFLFSFLV
jgi:hypothetical protein